MAFYHERGGIFIVRVYNENLNVCVYIYMLVLSRIQLYVTPWTVARQPPLSMGFSWQEYWSGLPFHIPGDLPNPGIELSSLTSPALAGGSYTTSACLGSKASVTIY